MNRDEAIQALREGNERFVKRSFRKREILPASTAGGQSPFCIVLSCADSRVPPELIFDHDLGELFVIRVAGNVASPETVASAEYAAAHLGSSLLLVLGHTSCGAITAARDHADDLSALGTESLVTLIGRLLPAVRETAGGGPAGHVDRAVARNVGHVIDALRKSPVIGGKERDEFLSLAGGVYDLVSGRVTFLD